MSISIQDILPDPNYRYGDSGQDNTGPFGPGFKAIKLSSETSILNSRTNSGRIVSRHGGSHAFKISISYNPMLREQFEPVYSFLLSRGISLKPFFISLPHLRASRNSTFDTYLQTGGTPPQILAQGDTAGGSTSILCNGFTSISGEPKPGDLFHIDDISSTQHKKAYQVTRVETNAAGTFEGTQPGVNQRKIHFFPPLSKQIFQNGELVFVKPLIRVVMDTPIQEYSLNENGLYKFSLSLKEAQL